MTANGIFIGPNANTYAHHAITSFTQLKYQRRFGMESNTPANDMQVGGSHYKDMGVQPWDVMQSVLTPEEFRGFLKGNIIKYAMRQGRKDSDDAGK